MLNFCKNYLLITLIIIVKYENTNGEGIVWNDDGLMTSVLEKVKLVNVANDNLSVKMDINQLRWLQEMETQNKTLADIKTLLETQQQLLNNSVDKLVQNSAEKYEGLKSLTLHLQQQIEAQKFDLQQAQAALAADLAEQQLQWQLQMSKQSESLQKIEKLLADLYNLTAKTSNQVAKQPTVNVTCPTTASVRNLNNTKLPSSCAEAFKFTSRSGIYQLHSTDPAVGIFYAYCLQDPINGRAWTIIQRRHDGSVDFYRNWTDYKHGFGDLHGEHFMGLQKIHAMTYAQPHELWIQMESFAGVRLQARYDAFAVDSEATKYTLNVLGKFQGNATDTMYYLLGQKFSTKDSDNDEAKLTNCALKMHGAWWYRSCHECSNLNGFYTSDANLTNPRLQWSLDEEGAQPFLIKYVHMAIRPKVKYM